MVKFAYLETEEKKESNKIVVTPIAATEKPLKPRKEKPQKTRKLLGDVEQRDLAISAMFLNGKKYKYFKDNSSGSDKVLLEFIHERSGQLLDQLRGEK